MWKAAPKQQQQQHTPKSNPLSLWNMLSLALSVPLCPLHPLFVSFCFCLSDCHSISLSFFFSFLFLWKKKKKKETIENKNKILL